MYYLRKTIGNTLLGLESRRRRYDRRPTSRNTLAATVKVLLSFVVSDSFSTGIHQWTQCIHGGYPPWIISWLPRGDNTHYRYSSAYPEENGAYTLAVRRSCSSCSPVIPAETAARIIA